MNKWIISQSKVKLEEKLLFFELLFAILNAGVSLSEALRLLTRQIENPRLKMIVEGMQNSIESGESLAESMSHTPDVFDKATCSIIAAGEKSGKLNEVLKELVAQYERMNSISKKVSSVMTYPIIVVTVMVVLVIAVMLFVVPKLTDLFGGAANLPLPTRILIGGSDLFINKWPVLLAGLAGFIGIFMTWKKSAIGKWQSDQIALYIPIFGEFIKKISLSRFTRIFSFLINSGVPIIDGLRISSRVTGNQVYEKKLLLAADDLTRGIEISENFADDTRLFPTMLVRMMSIGEKQPLWGRSGTNWRTSTTKNSTEK
ncbi:type II secretion system F family protein [Candidatus Gracilibacteria bacterium]|nr:type II secretion system F family protein [Candidatus Gracilibacteria bacterium]